MAASLGRDEKRASNRLHSKDLIFSSHFEYLVRGLYLLRKVDSLCDVTLIVENKTFRAHRAVLAACSDYFRLMFTNQMSETQQTEINLNGIKAEGMELLMDYIYTGELELTSSNIKTVLSVATLIQIPTVIEACCNYLKSEINLETCLKIVDLAELYDLNSLKYKSYRYMCSRLNAFSDSLHFGFLTWSQLQFILSCNYPVDCSEAELLKIVHQYCTRTDLKKDLAQLLFSEIDFKRIDADDLKDALNKLSESEDKSHCFVPLIKQEITKQLRKGKQVEKSQSGTEVEPKPMPQAETFELQATAAEENITLKSVINTRGMELALVIIGGYQHSGLTNQISCYLPSVGKWEPLTVIPHIEQCDYGSAVVDNELYIVGGSYDDCLKEHIHPFGFRYCPIKDKWKPIAAIQKDRCSFTLNAIGNYLYAVGGELLEYENWQNDLNVLNCERYDVSTNCWEYFPPLTEDRSAHAGVAHNNKLYISGGYKPHWPLSSLWCFDIESNEWQELSRMPSPRADHALILYKECLYACGGWTEDVLTGRQLVNTIEVYDIQKNVWSVETTNPNPTSYSGVVALNGRIYFIGGLLNSRNTSRATKSLQCYDLATKQWSSNADCDYHEEIWECTLTALYIPQKQDIKDYWKQ